MFPLYLCIKENDQTTGYDDATNKVDNLEEAAAALALLSLAEDAQIPATSDSQTTQTGSGESTGDNPNNHDLATTAALEPHPIQNAKKHQLEERVSRKDGAIQSFKRHKSSSNDAGNPEGASTESQSVMATNINGAQQTESMTLAATIQSTQQALLQCGQDASLAPFVAMIQHVGQQMIKSQHELENDRRKWENRQREMEGRHILHPTQGSMEALVNQAGPAGVMKTWQQEHDDSKRLQEMRNDCWAAVTRLLVEVVLIHRLANHLGLLILRSWKRIEQQGALYDDDPLSRFGLWISALTELVRKSIKLVLHRDLLFYSMSSNIVLRILPRT